MTPVMLRSLSQPALTTLLLVFLIWQPAIAHYAEHEHSDELHTVQQEMVEVAQSILDTVAGSPGGIESAVGYNRRELLGLEMDAGARTNYVYWPYLREGLPLDFMDARQKALTHDLLNTALSAKGYLSTVQIMQMEEILADAEVTGFPRGTENYTLAIFGTPSMEGEWGWRFEGHHLSLNFTLAPAGISVTPSFFGASPAEISSGNMAGYRNLRSVHEAGRNLINALDSDQRELAIVSDDPPFDILAGTLNRPQEQWDDWKRLEEAGIALASLSDSQKALARIIIDEVITTYRPEISEAYLARIDLDEISFTWHGGTGANDPHYYRLDGPDFFFEYDLVQNDGNHVHTVWRSKSGDFGEDLLMRHRLGDDHPH